MKLLKWLKESPAMGVISGTGAELRRYPKTGQSKDFLLSRERNLTPANRTGFANSLAHYIDPLDPQKTSKKIKKKPKYAKRNMHEKECPPGFIFCKKHGKCIPQQERRDGKAGIVDEELLVEKISEKEVKEFERKWKKKLAPYGLTNFKFSNHANFTNRLNDTRNKPPITTDELDFVMDGFIRKMGSQFRKDIENVKNNTARKRGKNKKEIPDNNLEFTIKSASNKVNFTIVLKQDFNKKGTAMILPATVMRKKNWVTKKGEEIMVERRIINMDLIDKYLYESKDLRKGKTDYTTSDLRKLGWATVGGRIEDYADMYDKVGSKKTYKEIFKRYGEENAEDVWRGLMVLKKFGTAAYYHGKI